jgi:hypothetical protein
LYDQEKKRGRRITIRVVVVKEKGWSSKRQRRRTQTRLLIWSVILFMSVCEEYEIFMI